MKGAMELISWQLPPSNQEMDDGSSPFDTWQVEKPNTERGQLSPT